MTAPARWIYCLTAEDPHPEEERMGKGDYTIKMSQRKRQRRLKRRLKRIAAARRVERAAAR